MPKRETEESMRQAMVALVDAKDPVTKGRLMRSVVDHIAADGRGFSDLIDLVFSLDDPRRMSTRTDIAEYLKAHPGGEWTQKRDDDLRRAIASDRSLPRSFFRDA